MATELDITQDGRFKEMLDAGVIYGHKKSKTHPKMKPFIFSSRNNIELINPEVIISSLDKAKKFLEEKTEKGAVVFLAASQPAAQKTIEDFAKKHSLPYMTERWLGGILTNFKVISSRVAYYLDLKARKEKGELDKYTKKERVKIDKELIKMEKAFSGLPYLTKLPEILFMIDSEEHKTAVNEAKRMKIPVIAVISTDCDPSVVDYPIPASDHSKASIEFILNYLEPAFKKAPEQNG